MGVGEALGMKISISVLEFAWQELFQELRTFSYFHTLETGPLLLPELAL